MNKLNTNDLDFNFTAHPVTGDITIKNNLTSIKQSLKNILMTSILERPFNTNLNLNLYSYLFENFNIYYIDILTDEIKRIITFNEPRIAVDKIDLNFQENDGILTIVINFSLIDDSNAQNELTLTIERQR